MTYYWVSMFEYIYSTKIRNNTLDVPFGIIYAITDPENHLRVNRIIENEIGFLLEIDHYSCD